jgi:hypothetical protein
MQELRDEGDEKACGVALEKIREMSHYRKMNGAMKKLAPNIFKENIMKTLVVIVLAICFGPPLPAQSPLGIGAGGGAADFSAVSKLFGNNHQFTALTETREA